MEAVQQCARWQQELLAAAASTPGATAATAGGAVPPRALATSQAQGLVHSQTSCEPDVECIHQPGALVPPRVTATGLRPPSQQGPATRPNEEETYGLQSVVFEARAPFHPVRLCQFISWLGLPDVRAQSHGPAGCAGGSCGHDHRQHQQHQQIQLNNQQQKQQEQQQQQDASCSAAQPASGPVGSSVHHGDQQHPHCHADQQHPHCHADQQHLGDHSTHHQGGDVPRQGRARPRVIRSKGFFWLACLPGVGGWLGGGA